MLEMNQQICEIRYSELRYVTSLFNSKRFYSFLVDIEFTLQNEKGYISFYIGDFEEKNIKNIEEKEFFTNDYRNSNIQLLEIYDTKNFIDDINGSIDVKFGRVVDNTIEINVVVEDEFVHLKYNGILIIKNSFTYE